LVGLEVAESAHRETMQTLLLHDEESDRFKIDDEAETGGYESRPEVSDDSGLPGFVDESSIRSLGEMHVTRPYQSVSLDVQSEALSSLSGDFFGVSSNTPDSAPLVKSVDAPAQAQSEVSPNAADIIVVSPEIHRMETRGGEESGSSNKAPAKARMGSYWFTLTLGLVLASLIGASVAIWSTRQSPSVAPKTIPPKSEAKTLLELQSRYRMLRQKMNKVTTQGVTISPEINRKAASAADLLLLGQTREARQELDVIETYLDKIIQEREERPDR